jgi:hypothetical protein
MLSTRAHVLLALVTLGSIVFIISLVRRDRLRAKYSMLWVSIGLVLGVMAAVPGVLDRISAWAGVAYPPTMFFLLAIAFLFIVVVHFSWELSRLEGRDRVLAEEVALLRERLARVEAGEPAGRAKADERADLGAETTKGPDVSQRHA